jgi:NAD(P)-dependent dehydrogenase (short-subunit alcohol dehydrogenase family)
LLSFKETNLAQKVLVASGAKVYVVDRRDAALKTVVDIYDTGPGRIIPKTADISDKTSILELAASIAADEPDGIQLLVNNAGITTGAATRFDRAGTPDLNDASSISSHFLRSEPSHWASAFATNTTGGFFMSMAFLPLLAKGHEVIPGYTSSIINSYSNSTLLKHNTHGHISYVASKAATLHLSRILATTVAHLCQCAGAGDFPLRNDSWYLRSRSEI